MGADERVLTLRDGAATWTTEGDDTVALDLDRAWYLGMNPAGTLIWNALADGATRSELIERLQTRYALDAERAGTDVDAFVDSCRKRGLLA